MMSLLSFLKSGAIYCSHSAPSHIPTHLTATGCQPLAVSPVAACVSQMLFQDPFDCKDVSLCNVLGTNPIELNGIYFWVSTHSDQLHVASSLCLDKIFRSNHANCLNTLEGVLVHWSASYCVQIHGKVQVTTYLTPLPLAYLQKIKKGAGQSALYL